MSDSLGMSRMLSSIGHAGNMTEGSGGGMGHVLEIGVGGEIKDAIDGASRGGLVPIMLSVFNNITEPFKVEGFSLQVASSAMAQLGQLPSPLASLPKPSNLLGIKGGGGPGH